MKIGIFTVTQGGKKLGVKLKDFFPTGKLYTLEKFCGNDEDILPIKPDLKTMVGEVFHEMDYLIFIMATGIVVRSIAPYIKDKYQDPGILVMDEKGQNVISLLSGHIGGANDLTLKVADWLNINPVITTASDVQNTIAVDTLAQRLKCKINNWHLTKKVTAHIVNGNRVGIYWEDITPIDLPHNYEIVNSLPELLHKTYGIYIGNGNIEKKHKNILQLYPQNLVLGIGCRRGTSAITVLDTINLALREVNKSVENVKKIVTVDVKADEEGLIEAGKNLGISIEIISRKRIMEVEELFETSTFVKKAIGVGSVSEPCAYIGSNEGKLLVKKFKNQGVTVSIAEEKERR